MSYADFLAAKGCHAPDLGPQMSAEDLHPALLPWQAQGVAWAIRKGRCALFWDCGMGKTLAQVEWARRSAQRSLIVAPLSVARQTVREAGRIDCDVRYVRDDSQAQGPGVWITNYEMIEHFDPAGFGAVVLDESSILKNVDGRTRTRLIESFRAVPHRLCCSATPAPNDVAELTNHAEFLGVMSRAEMLAAYFVHDDDGWRIKGHAAGPMFAWMSTWAQAARRPSDLGHDDGPYVLPDLRIHGEVVDAHVAPEEGQLFAADLGGVSGRHRVRRETMDARVARVAELARGDEQWIVWCALNGEADAAARAIDGAVNVEGNWKPEDKAAALEAFQDGAIRVLVTKPKIAGFGMNFQNASRMAFLGLGDSYEAYYQAIRRSWRFGQRAPVDVHVIVSHLETAIVHNVRRKERDAQRMTSALIDHTRTPELLSA